ncbi:SwmB domain-containing protein [Paenibacillus sp. Marseille-Q4541]|uniref:SwmB domain-containing protein n=1 Tax=Paenibacillus sp. Marseille-Q4541 TaxID=2831522 RepID=UPI001BA9A70C|nr:SwmB domain-containing protein [Paenibacillus sp. Marseille-Q4541]
MKKRLSAALAAVMLAQVFLGSGYSIADAATDSNGTKAVTATAAISPTTVTSNGAKTDTSPTVNTFTLQGNEELTPPNGKLEVAKTPELAIKMSQPVKRGAGYIRLQRMSDNSEIKSFHVATDIKIYDVPSGREVGPEEYGTYITFSNFAEELPSGGYYLLMDQGVFWNERGEAFAGIQDASTWRFWTKGMGDVAVTEKVPAQGASKVLPTSTLSLTFAKEMYPAAGDIQIVNRNTGQVVDTIPVTSSKVSGGGSNSIRIKPTNNFENNTSYDVLIPSGAFWDAQQNKSAAINKGEWGFTVSTDTTALTVASLSPSDGSMSAAVDRPLVLTFNKPLDTSRTGTGNVTLRKAGGGTVNVSTVINGSDKRQLLITPLSNLENGVTYQVDVPGGTYYDAAGNTFAGLSGSSSWSFKTYTKDTKSPVLQSSKMYTNTLIKLTYDEVLNSSIRPLVSSYSVTVNGEVRNISDVSISGDSVYVMLDTGVAVGQVVRLSYTPGVRPVQDDAGNAVSSFSSLEIANGLNSVLSKPREGSVYGNTLYLYFTESVKVSSSSAVDQFYVTANGSGIGVNSISLSNGNVVTLILNRSVADGEVIRVTYTPGSYPLKDYRDQALAGFTDFFVRNSYDSKAPEFVEATAMGNKMYLKYNEALRSDNLPLKSQYSVLVGGSPLYVNAVEVNEDEVELTLANTLQLNQEVSISYVPGVRRLTDLNGNPAGYLNLVPVTIYGSGSVRQGIVQGQNMNVTMSEAMKSQTSLTTSQFAVTAGGQSVQVASASVQNQTLSLTLASAVLPDQIVTLSYLPGATPLRTAKGESVAGFGPFTLQNKTSGSSTGGSGGTSGMPSGLTALDASLFGQSGYALSSSAATRTTALSKYSRTVGSYTISSQTLQQAFTYASSAAGRSNTIVIDIPETEQAALAGFSLQALTEVYSKNKQAVIGVRYGDALYTLPLADIDMSAMATSVNSDAARTVLFLQLESVPSTSSVSIDTLLAGGKATKKTAIIDATAYAVNHLSQKAEQKVKGQLNLRVSLAGNATTSTLSLIRLDGTVQRLSHVPHQVQKTSSGYVFIAKLTGSQSIVVAEHPVQYMGLYGHWAKDAIERLAVKWIIDTESGSYYEPNTNITRSEFAGMIARGLGLEGSWDTAAKFSDVPYSTAGAYIGAAAKAGIITGHADGSFKPNQLITREQMSIMMVRALHYGGHQVSLNGTPQSILSKFKDRTYIQAPELVAEAVQQNLIQGITINTFKPAGNATKAQAAVMLTRMLAIYDTK